MKVRMQFYAQLRDLAGIREQDFDLAEGSTVGDLLDQIYVQHPALRTHDKSILIGVGVSWAITAYADWSTRVSLQAVFLGFFVSVTVGLVFGLYPAMKAARLETVEALHYE